MSIFYMMMNRRPFSSTILILLAGICLLPACARTTPPAPFRPPTHIAPTEAILTITPLPAQNAVKPTFTAAPIITPSEEAPCDNDLSFLEDITIPDGTVIFPAAPIDKQWLVQNTGTCNWDDTYRLRWIDGYPLSAREEQTIFPARAGTQATIRIVFTAPQTPGDYESSWQAVDPKGNVFGDLIYMKITVSE